MTATAAPAMAFSRQGLDTPTLLHLYEQLVKPRLIEEKMLNLLRQGRISKWFSGIGQEAISVGAACALLPDELIFTMHRNLGVFTARDMPLDRMFCQWQGKRLGYTKGRDRSFHFGAMEHGIVGMISHLGPQLSLAAGVALANSLKFEVQESSKFEVRSRGLGMKFEMPSQMPSETSNSEPTSSRGLGIKLQTSNSEATSNFKLQTSNYKVSLAFTGDGATSQGEFHEALNVAAVWKLPVIFLIENNQYGLSTTPDEQYACESLIDRAKGYGMRGLSIDGNDIIKVYATIRQLAEEMRERPEPVLLECLTFRMRGHEEASGTKYVPQELMDAWALRDPIDNYERWLLAEGLLTTERAEAFKADYKKEIQAAVDVMFAEPEPEPDTEEELRDVYAPLSSKFEVQSLKFEMPSQMPSETPPPPLQEATAGKSAEPTSNFKLQTSNSKEARFIDALSDGLRTAMRRHPNLVLMGQDIADYGGVFKITQGFMEEFGKARVRNTPLCESAIVGIGLGLSLGGYKSMVEMQFADFVTCGFNQIVNNLAKLHWRWGQPADVVIRMPTGGGSGAGPFHSQSNEAWFTHVPGLKVVYPSTPHDAKGLMLAAFEDPNPVMFFEHKALYRSESGPVPEGFYTVEIGKARQVREGQAVSILTYGLGVRWAEQAADEMGLDADIVDLRSLVPLDYAAIAASVRRTNRVLILHEDTLFGGIGGEIAAWISEHLFEHLDAPVLRAASLDTPVPFAIPLEQNFFPIKRLREQLEKLLRY